MIRLAKIIANAGISSRRDAEILITSGKVYVNNTIITNPATNIELSDDIIVSGQKIDTNIKPRLWIYYKPLGLITTNKDPQNRPTIYQYLTKLPRVISVGRLDINSEGLLLLTNNGDLARKLELPVNKIDRIYKVRAFGKLDFLVNFIKNKTRFMINFDSVNYNIKQIKIITSNKDKFNNWFEIILTEGKNREVRKIFEYFNLTANTLVRIQFGNFSLSNLKPGECIEARYDDFKHYLL